MKLFVWDFHGVLEKDNELAVLDISNQVLRQAGYKERFSSEDNKRLYGLKWYQYFEQLLPNLTNDEHLTLQAACFRYAEENLHILAKHIKPADHAGEVLGLIAKQGHDQVVVSNTRQGDLEWFISAVALQQYFPVDKIFGVNAHEKRGNKKEALEQYVEHKSFDSIVIIGDSADDMALVKVAGGTTYFYHHPHHKKVVSKIQADYKITDLRLLLEEL